MTEVWPVVHHPNGSTKLTGLPFGTAYEVAKAIAKEVEGVVFEYTDSVTKHRVSVGLS